jgi:hypothetical protein
MSKELMKGENPADNYFSSSIRLFVGSLLICSSVQILRSARIFAASKKIV